MTAAAATTKSDLLADRDIERDRRVLPAVGAAVAPVGAESVDRLVRRAHEHCEHAVADDLAERLRVDALEEVQRLRASSPRDEILEVEADRREVGVAPAALAAGIRVHEPGPRGASADALRRPLTAERRPDLHRAQAPAALRKRHRPVREIPLVLDVVDAADGRAAADEVVAPQRLPDLGRAHPQLHLPDADAGIDRRLGARGGRDEHERERADSGPASHEPGPRIPGDRAWRQSPRQLQPQLGWNSGNGRNVVRTTTSSTTGVE